MIVRNIQAVWARPAMAVPKRDTFRLVSDYQAVNSQVDQTPKVMADLLRGLDCIIRAGQKKAIADFGVNLRSFQTTSAQVTLANDDLFRVCVGNRDVLWILSGDKALQVRSMVCAHMRSAGHRVVSPTLFRLKEYCVWSHMESHVREFVHQCLHCVDTPCWRDRASPVWRHGTRYCAWRGSPFRFSVSRQQRT